MSEIPMNERNIVFFPMQSVQIGVDEDDNPIYDNAADAEILQKLRQMEIKDGVYPDDSTYLQVMSNGDMTVTVKAGYAHVRGVQVWMKEDVTLALEAADDLVDRVDRVVLRISFQDRDVTLAVKTGDTALTRAEGQTWELGLADIAVDHLNDTVTQAEITDLRLDTTACGVVSGLMQVDTQSIFNQYMTWWEDQQDTSGYLTVDGEYPSLNTTSKKVFGAINEAYDNIGSFKESRSLGEDITLTTDDVGRVIRFSSSGTFSVVLPSLSSIPDGSSITLVNTMSGGTLTISSFGPAIEPIRGSGIMSGSFVLPMGASVKLSANATVTWLAEACVSIFGNQTISGEKTFSSFPVTPSSAPSSNYQAANKKYVDDKAASTENVYITASGQASSIGAGATINVDWGAPTMVGSGINYNPNTKIFTLPSGTYIITAVVQLQNPGQAFVNIVCGVQHLASSPSIQYITCTAVVKNYSGTLRVEVNTSVANSIVFSGTRLTVQKIA